MVDYNICMCYLLYFLLRVVFIYMLEYLILNRKFEAAKAYEATADQGLVEILTRYFTKGNREQFFTIFGLLRKQLKLEFYLRVYFCIFTIHPFTNTASESKKQKQSIPQKQINAFKDFIENRGAQLAKTNEFLQFYALPYIKKPLEHDVLKKMFKKEWVNVLKEKLIIFLNEQLKRIKIQSKKLAEPVTNLSKLEQSSADKHLSEKVKEMEKINQELFEEVKQFAEKCQILEESHQMMTEGFHTHMMEAQSKWFQITKQLVDCSKSLIGMLISQNSDFLSDKKFLKIKKRTDKYEKFVNKKFQDLVSHSQDISLFDRPSINELSCSVMPYTQKSNGPIIKDFSTILNIDEYIPTDFIALQKQFRKSSTNQKIAILNGLTYRIAKSKDKSLKRLHISGIFKYDFLGFNSGEISQLLASHQLMKSTVKLIQLISQDSFGRKLLFVSNNIHRDFIGLMHSCNDKTSLESIMSMLSVFSSQKKFKLEIIELDIIEGCVNLLRKGKQDDNESILEIVTTILLNTIMMHEGLAKFEKEKDIFDILKKYVKTPFKLVKTFVYGIIYSLLESSDLFKLANQQKMRQFFQKLPKIDTTISKQQIALLKEKISHFHPKEIAGYQSEDEESEDEDDDDDDYPIIDIEDYSKNHQELATKYSLKTKQAKKQYAQVKQFYEEIKRSHEIPKFYQPKNNVQIIDYSSPKNNSAYNSKNNQLVETPYIKEISSHKHDRYEKIEKNQAPIQQKIDNFVSPPQKQVNQRNNRDFRIKDKDMNKLNLSRQKKIEQNEQCNQRIKKSVSADRGIGRSPTKEEAQIYQSNRIPRNRVSEFKNAEERGFRSPQGKKVPREELLKQLNEQLQAGQIKRKKDIHENRNRQSQKSMKSGQVQEKQYNEAFQARPKIRRSPPKQ